MRAEALLRPHGGQAGAGLRGQEMSLGRCFWEEILLTGGVWKLKCPQLKGFGSKNLFSAWFFISGPTVEPQAVFFEGNEPWAVFFGGNPFNWGGLEAQVPPVKRIWV